MYQRPKFGESDEDLLKLQEEFTKHKASTDFKLASTLVPSSSLPTSKNEPHTCDIPKTSEVEEHFNNTFEDIPTNMQIGNIIEKRPTTAVSQFKLARSGFPQAKRRDSSIGTASQSIFSQQMKKFKLNQDQPTTTSTSIVKENIKDNMEVESTPTAVSSTSSGEMSSIKKEIHIENLDKMSTMSSEEILEEREKLRSTLDPAIIAFLKSKRHHSQPKVETRQLAIAQQNKEVEEINIEDIQGAHDVLTHNKADKWIHFDVLESNKLAWMKNINIKPETATQGKEENYEARFDFDGWLLPYTENEMTETNRTLYHHGEEPDRPGYTLQELFQLSRSNVLQQKIIALNTIAAILNLYSTGIYDGIFDLPIEQIFFVLRFCLDENTPATLNACIKAMRNLFCCHIDEVCLDCLLGFGLGKIQPVLAVDFNDGEDDNTVNDQQLAESNLIKCFVRSGILIRIRYIITVVKPTEIETITNCLDILIRLARDSDFVALQVWKFERLIPGVVEFFIPKNFTVKSASAYNTPILQAIKLMRVLGGRKREIAEQLTNKYKILDSVTSYLANESLSLNTAGLKLQIEALQLWETLAYYNLGIDYFNNLRPVLLKLVDYHVKNTNVDASWTKQTHFSAILNLIGQIITKTKCESVFEYIRLIFELGSSKWLTQFQHLTVHTCGKMQLISALFSLLTILCNNELAAVQLPWETVHNLISKLLASRSFKILTENLKLSSNILNNYELHKSSANLLCVESVAWDAADHIVPILQTKSCIPFLCVFSEFLATCTSNNLKLMCLNHENIQSYLKNIQLSHNFYLTTNWYTKVEAKMISNLLQMSVQVQKHVETSLFFEVAVKSLSIFTAEQKPQVEYLFKNIIFCTTFYPSDVLLRHLNLQDEDILRSALSNIENIQKVYTDILALQQNLPDFTSKRTLNIALGNIMPIDWVYSPIIALYSNTEPSKVSESTQNFIISNCLRWVYIYETYFPDLANMINATDKFCRLACTFLGSDSLFLIPEIQQLLRTCLQQILAQHSSDLDFDKGIHGLKSFQDLYIQLLEQYQGVSYGDTLFGQFLLVPLAQRHNVKFRKAIWSEYAGIIQIFNVTQEDLFGNIDEYLTPVESDLSLLRCYQRILSANAVRKNCVFYQIARHHVDAYKNRKQNMKMDTE